MKKNIVYVTTDLSDKNLWSKELNLESIHWISESPAEDKKYKARLRHRGPLIDCRIKDSTLILTEEQRAISSGQSTVIYDSEQCLGGGIISQAK